jgi:modification methylase hgaIA
MAKKIKGMSMFSSAGIGEIYLKDIGIDIILANELIEKRANFYKDKNPNSKVIIGDITESKIFDQLQANITDDIKLLIATPPCQGMSNLGKNKSEKSLLEDKRNYLFLKVIEIIDNNDFDYILIENVPKFLNMKYSYNGKLQILEDFLNAKYSLKYNIKINEYNVKDYGVPQSRPRAIIRMFKKDLVWLDPIPQKEITLKEAIGHLPSLESGQKSSLKNHNARVHLESHIKYMKHTPTGKSAFENEVFFPKKENGERIKGYKSTYKRMSWDKPAPAITMRSDAISSQENVHPGRKLKDGTYSDARVLTLRELFILFSIPENWEVDNYSDTFIRQIVGEGIPPKFLYEVMKGII